jgi:Na+/alanine symporter
MALGYHLNWRSFWMLFITIALIIGFAEINYISNLSNFYDQEIQNEFLLKISSNSNQFFRIIGNIVYQTYNFIYFKILNIPIVFWLLIAINIFLIYILKLENIRFISNSIFAAFEINKNRSIDSKYLSFKEFICSSYGAISVAAISEIIILLKNYNTPGSIFWMCITILLLGLIQLCEIIINCHYVRNNKDQSCFICILQYVVNRYSKISKNQKLVKFLSVSIGVYIILMILTSFFSATMFQVEQIANFYLENFNDHKLKTLFFIGFGTLVIFLLASVQRFKISLKINNFIISPILIIFIFITSTFVIIHSSQAIQTIILIFEDIGNPKSILPGVVSGLVVSLARYIYKKNNDYSGDHWSIYEENDLTKATVMYTVESLFMIFLIIVSGISFFIFNNFTTNLIQFTPSILYLISIFLVIFCVSVVINEAIYSKAALAHIFNLTDKKIGYIVRIVLALGVIMGFFHQTDSWVDTADHFSVIFLIINLLAFFFIMKDKEVFSNCYKKNECEELP